MVRVDHVAYDAQADAASAHLRVHGAAPAEEGLENVRQILRIDPESAIGDTDPNG